MKNLVLGLALVAGICACSTPAQKNAVSDGATGAKPEACAGSCEGAKASCCEEKAGEAKTCTGMKKVQG
ncbi:MAG TPA: hypothetical protein VM509_05325 [Planctomycetota bacterium]|nr:hypothetical protein [Planctomycetota bacterium]